jgi:hypothetical protein
MSQKWPVKCSLTNAILGDLLVIIKIQGHSVIYKYLSSFFLIHLNIYCIFQLHTLLISD